MAGHATVVSRRGLGYIAELPLRGEYPGLVVSGRADGYDPDANLLEEIKTHRGDVARIPQNHRLLHWAQVKVYGWLLCQTLEIDAIDLAVVYFNVITQKETEFRERFAAADLRAFFDLQCQRFVQWAEQESAHRVERDQGLEALRFPYADFRQGQRMLAESVYRAARDEQDADGPGHHRHRQDPRHAVPATQGLPRAEARPTVASSPPRRRADAWPWTPWRPCASRTPASRCGCWARRPRRPASTRTNPATVSPARWPRGFYDRLPAAREAALSAAG